jgi:hypothetical protein
MCTRHQHRLRFGKERAKSVHPASSPMAARTVDVAPITLRRPETSSSAPSPLAPCASAFVCAIVRPSPEMMIANFSSSIVPRGQIMHCGFMALAIHSNVRDE